MKKTQGNRSAFYNIFLAKEDIKIVINYVHTSALDTPRNFNENSLYEASKLCIRM